MTTLFAAILSAVMLSPNAQPQKAGPSAPEPRTQVMTIDVDALRALPVGTKMPRSMDALGARGMVVTGHVPQDAAGSPGAEMLMFEDPVNPVWRGRLLLNEGRASGVVYVNQNLRVTLSGHPKGRTELKFEDPMGDLPCGFGVLNEVGERNGPLVPPVESLVLPPCGDDIVIDVLIAYTYRLWLDIEQTYLIEDRARWSIGDLNETSLRSDAGAYFRLVGIRRLSSQHIEGSAMECDLYHLSEEGEPPIFDPPCFDSPVDEGKWDEVHEWRDELQADLVCLFRADGANACGLANLGGGSPTQANLGFSVVAWGCIPGQTVTHELGHNMGCCHAPNDGGGCENGGLNPDSYGHRFEAFPFGPNGPPQTYRTVMAYDPGTRIPHYSNPQINYLNVPTGANVCQFDREDAECNVPQGCQTECPGRDNAKTIRQTRSNISKYRCSGFPAPTVRAWGGWDHGQTPPPPGVNLTIQVAAGGPHMMALKVNGTVSAWGVGTGAVGVAPNYGQAQVPFGLANVKQIAAGGVHSLALRNDGTVVGWGAGETNSGISPHFGQSVVPAGLANVVEIDAGGFHSVARLQNGTLRAWGRNESGQCNLGTLSDYAQVRAGATHTLARTTTGAIRAFGDPANGQSNVPTGLAPAVDIDAGWSHSVVVLNNGTVRCFGAGSNALLTGTPPHWGQSIVPTGLNGVTKVAAGYWHTVALRTDGTVRVWGRNDNLQATVPNGLTNIVGIAAGKDTTAVLRGPLPTPCPFDLNDDRVIDGNDLGRLLAFWGPCAGPSCQADFDGNSFVDADDLGRLLAAWGPCP